MSDDAPLKDSSPSDTQSSFSDLADEHEPGILREFWDFLKYNKKWWLTPILLVLFLVAVLVLLANLYPAALPFIYTMH